MSRQDGRGPTASEARGALAARIASIARAGRSLAASLGYGRVLALVLLACVLVLRAEDSDILRTIRFQGFDLLQQANPRALASDRVAIVDVDEASIQELGQWPWDRSRLASLVTALHRSGAASIGFDMVFAEPDRLSPPAYADHAPGLPPMMRGVLAGLQDTDAGFAQAIAEAPVVLGMSGMTTRPAPGAAPLPASAAFAEFGGDPRRFLFGFPSALRNIAVLERSAPGLGLFSLTPEHDGVVRRPPAALRIGERLYPSLSLDMLRLAAGAGHMAIALDPSGAGVRSVRVKDLDIPTDRNGRLWLRYAKHRPDLYIPAKDVLEAGFDPARVRGKLVLVGASAIGLRDLRITPLGETIPGVEIHAQAIDSALSGALLDRPVYAVGLEHGVALLIGGLLILLAPGLTAKRGLPLYAAVVIGLAATAWIAFSDFGYVFDATYPALAATLVFAAVIYGNFSQADAQRRRIRSAFNQYLSPDMVERLAENPDSLRLGGESREMTFLFCDIAGFTSFVEQSDPEILVALLNEYLDGVCGIVMDHGGTIDKIVGDAVHAMFNAPLDDPEHAEHAVACALAIEAFVNDFRRRKRAQGFEFGETRIGVNSGRAIVGNFGGGRRFDYTAHGDAINTAARLESANKQLGTSILISESAARLCPKRSFRPIGRLILKGKESAVMTYEPARQQAAAVAPYEAAFALLAARSADALAAFRKLAGEAPDDPLVALHCRRLAEGASGVDIVMGAK